MMKITASSVKFAVPILMDGLRCQKGRGTALVGKHVVGDAVNNVALMTLSLLEGMK